MYERVSLQPVDAVDVTILVDNCVHLDLPSTTVVQRPRLREDWLTREPLRAEHGAAMLLTVVRDGWRASLLYDAGLGRDTATHNIDLLDMQSGDVEAIVLSHGHADHHGGLEAVVRRVGRPALPLVLHPDAWRERRLVLPNGENLPLPPPQYDDVARAGVNIVEERSPTLLLDGTVLTTGQIERATGFECGMPGQQTRTPAGDWEPDPWVWDDQAVVCHLKHKGLVVLSSCSHAGIINILRYARQLTGIDLIYALIGGLHLSGADMAANITPTMVALSGMAPAVLVPGHCTGEQAIHELLRRFPQAYVQSSVGTRLHLISQDVT